MTDCSNAERRDQLPDLVHGTLSATAVAELQAHLAGCSACTDELAVIRTAWGLRPSHAAVDVAAIVRQLPRSPAANRPGVAATSSVDVRGGRVRWRAASAWRMAAGVGLLIAGGWSVHLMRSGSVAMLTAGSSDSVQLAAVAESHGGVLATTATAPVTVAIGSVSEYTDEELEKLLERVNRWDGATSAEVSTMATPILPVSTGGIHP